MQNVLLTGIPRSGLTVVAALVDTLPDTVCLNEPRWQKRKASQIKKSLPYCKWLVGDFAWRRMQLLNEKPILDWRAPDGKPVLDSRKDPRLSRDEAGEFSTVAFTRPGLSKDFTLAMKHHSLYTALLPDLVRFEHFKIIAVIRHPFDVIQSWHDLKGSSISKGKITQAAKYWPEAARISDLDTDVLDRMVQLYEAFCQRYYELKDQIEIIKFEDVKSNPALVSDVFGIEHPAAAASLIEERPRVLIREETETLKEKFKKNSVFTKHFYKI